MTFIEATQFLIFGTVMFLVGYIMGRMRKVTS